MKDIFKCPKCNKVLSKYHNESNIIYKCKENHSYDLNKKGYLHLLLSNQMNSKDPGDNKEMMEARRNFLSKGYYDGLRDQLNNLVSNNQFVLDLGCGEGYYTSSFAKNNQNIIGTDISKSMIQEASKELKIYDNLYYIISSNNNIPIIDNAIDCIVNCFAPIDLKEAKRVFTKDGKLFKIIPGEKHLFELKELLYDKPYLNKVERINDSSYQLNKSYSVNYKINLNKEDLKNLFKMTPYYFKTKGNGLEKIEKIDSLTITLDFIIDEYNIIK